MVKKVGLGRERGHIRQRGNSYQVIVFAGYDPLTGKELRLTESTTDPDRAKAILRKICAQVDEQRHAKTKVTLPTAVVEWLRSYEVAETTKRCHGQAGRPHHRRGLGAGRRLGHAGLAGDGDRNGPWRSRRAALA